MTEFPQKRLCDEELLEGVLAYFPRLAARLDVVRVAWPKPRRRVISAVGIENQSLPLLLLADDASTALATGPHP